VTCEEVFGSVLSVLSFSNLREALTIANSTEYGLLTEVWTGDINKAHYLATKIKAGQVYINSYGAGMVLSCLSGLQEEWVWA
jgi:aldehyde dehydrogenase (NAD+)